jgi:hypothetical protein
VDIISVYDEASSQPLVSTVYPNRDNLSSNNKVGPQGTRERKM